jgi:hypothetical protein
MDTETIRKYILDSISTSSSTIIRDINYYFEYINRDLKYKNNRKPLDKRYHDDAYYDAYLKIPEQIQQWLKEADIKYLTRRHRGDQIVEDMSNKGYLKLGIEKVDLEMIIDCIFNMPVIDFTKGFNRMFDDSRYTYPKINLYQFFRQTCEEYHIKFIDYPPADKSELPNESTIKLLNECLAKLEFAEKERATLEQRLQEQENRLAELERRIADSLEFTIIL